MIDVIQILKSVERIDKSDYTTASRQLLDQWDNSFVSSTGFLTDRTVILPPDTVDKLDQNSVDLIIIQDIKSVDSYLDQTSWDTTNIPEWFKNGRRNDVLLANEPWLGFNRPSKIRTFDIFKIEKIDSGVFDIHLNYSVNRFHIGVPSRADHKIGELKLHKPIRYRLNGKSDFTLTGRKQRTFVEYDYLFEYLGQADTIEFMELNKIKKTKSIPIDNCKLVDERKLLK